MKIEWLQSRRPQASLLGGATGIVVVFLVALTVYPLGRMFWRSFFGSEGSTSWGDLFSEPWFGPMVRDTAISVGAGVVVAIVSAAVLAWINERTDAGIGIFGDVLPLVPLFLPHVALTVGWVMLAAPDVGFLNGFLAWLGGPFGITPSVNIFSHAGMAFVYSLMLLPYAYLPISAALKSMGSSLEEAARVSGGNPLQVFRTVAIPAIKPAVIAALVLVSIVGLGIYSVPAIIGSQAEIDNVSLRIIESVRNVYPPAYDTAVMLSGLLFAVMLMLWLLQKRVVAAGNFAQITGKHDGRSVTRLGVWKWPVRLILLSYIVLAAGLPVLGLLVVSFQTYWQPSIADSTWTTDHYDKLFFGSSGIAGHAVKNSVALGLSVGLVTVLVAAMVMLYVNRSSTLLARLGEAAAKTPAAIPNTIIAVGFVLTLAGSPFWLGGTLMILALGYLLVSVPYAAITAEASIAQVHDSMREASALSGASEGATFRKIVIPLIMPGLFAAWALVFVRILGDLSMSVLLGTGQTPVMGYVLLDIWEQGSFNRVAALALVVTVIVTPIVLLMLWLGTPKYRRRSS